MSIPQSDHSSNTECNIEYDSDEDITQYKAQYLIPLSVTTSTIAYDSTLRISYEDLSKYVKADGKTILAVKSTCLPLEECLMGGAYTKAERILKRRARNKQKRGSNFSRPSRTLSGNQLYFQSSVEFVHVYGYKYHNIRISPARGSIQIQGVKEPVFETAKSQILDTIRYIREKMCITDNFKLFNRRVIIINVKSALKPKFSEENIFIRVDRLAILIHNLMEKQKNNEQLPLEIPYRIIFVTNSYEAGSYIRIKFITPIRENLNRKTTIKVFSGCKINFLGSPTLECPYHIYKFLDKFIGIYKDDLLYKKEEKNERDSIDSYITNLHQNKYTWVRMIKGELLDMVEPEPVRFHCGMLPKDYESEECEQQ